MEETEHTPTPWYFWPRYTDDGSVIATVPEPEGRCGNAESAEGIEVLGISEWLRADDRDLRFIVLAANSHDALLRACERGLAYCEALRAAWAASPDGATITHQTEDGSVVRSMSAFVDLDRLFNDWYASLKEALASAKPEVERVEP